MLTESKPDLSKADGLSQLKWSTKVIRNRIDSLKKIESLPLDWTLIDS